MPTGFRPKNPKNAIQEANIAVWFGKQFSEDQLKHVDDVRATIEKFFPTEQPVMGFSVSINPAAPEALQPRPRRAGFIFQRASPGGQVQDWVLQIQQNFIAVNCLSYEDWATYRGRARDCFQLLLPRFVSAEFPITQISLQYIDHFFADWPVPAGAVRATFRRDSRLLSPRVFDESEQWHANQGWFETRPAGRVLSLLNISLAHVPPYGQLIVDNTLRLDIAPEESARLIGEAIMTKLDSVSEDFHTRNKQLLAEVLSDDMLRQIGMKQ